jgi:hypothetical protein
MATIEIELSEDEMTQFNGAAAERKLSPAALGQRWIGERLIHELEKETGGGRPVSPAAGHEAGKSGPS